MILEFILKAPHAPMQYRIQTEPVAALLVPFSQAPVSDGLIERVLLTNEDELANAPEGEPVRGRTWAATKWELRMQPRMWVFYWTELTELPGAVKPGAVARR